MFSAPSFRSYIFYFHFQAHLTKITQEPLSPKYPRHIKILFHCFISNPDFMLPDNHSWHKPHLFVHIAFKIGETGFIKSHPLTFLGVKSYVEAFGLLEVYPTGVYKTKVWPAVQLPITKKPWSVTWTWSFPALSPTSQHQLQHLPVMQKNLNTKVRSKSTFLEHKCLCRGYNIALDLLTVVLKNKGKKQGSVFENRIMYSHWNYLQPYAGLSD